MQTQQGYQNFSIHNQKFIARKSEKEQIIVFFQKNFFFSNFRRPNVECSFDEAAESFLPKNRKFLAHCPEVIRRLTTKHHFLHLKFKLMKQM